MTGDDAPPGPAGNDRRFFLPRRKLDLGLSAAAAAPCLLIRALPKSRFSKVMPRRRLPSERKRLDSIADGVAEDCRFPFGGGPARVVLARDPDSGRRP